MQTIIFDKQTNKQTALICVILACVFLAVVSSVTVLIVRSVKMSQMNYEEDYPIKDSGFVIHATGALDGNAYLNCAEALDACMENECFLIEIDFMFTADNEVVCTHEFENIDGFSLSNRPTLAEFKSTRVVAGDKTYTPLTFEYLLEVMAKYKQLKVVFDSKEGNFQGWDTSALIEKMIDQAGKAGINLRKRMIVQVYSIENYEDLQKFEFNDYWYTNYKKNYSAEKIKECFEDKANLTVYVMWASLWDEFYKAGFTTQKKIAVHTVNNKDYMNRLFESGVSYIYTDIIGE